MKSGLFLSLAAACCFAQAAAPLPSSTPAASSPSPSTASTTSATSASAASVDGAMAVPAPSINDKAAAAVQPSVSASAQPSVPASALPAAAGAPAEPVLRPASTMSSSTGSLLQTIFGLVIVLALLAGLAWFLKRYGPRNVGGNAALRLVGTLNLGGRERIIVVEVADQWIVVGASPGRLNALATLPRQDSLPPGLMTAQNGGLAATNFSEWLKQTIEKRNGK